jgi:hypothetical protein
MFQQVDVPHLQLNQTYKIHANNYVFKGRFKGFRYFDEIKLVFEPSPHLSLEFDNVHNISRDLHFIRTNIIYTRPVYQFVSQNPKWNMERRAVNKILRRLIGDECFHW